MRAFRLSAFTLVLLLAASAASAYTIYLKDGSRLVAAQKYRIDGDRALITLQSGTTTAIKASEIDVARTEEANKGNYGTAVVLEGAAVVDKPVPVAPPAGKDLSSLIAARGVGPRDLPDVKRPEPLKGTPTTAGMTPGGFPDFATVPHNALSVELTGEIQRVFFEHGLREVAIWRGTKPDRALVEVTVTSEATVFKTLAIVAKLLDEVRAQHRTDLAAVELSLVSAQGGRGGQFLMTQDQAADLLSNKIDISTYYVANLQF